MNTEKGICTDISTKDDGSKIMFIKIDSGCPTGYIYELFFSALNGYNHSVKKGDIVNVYYKDTITAGTVSYKVRRRLKEKSNATNKL